jgi:uncharacterized delta-60 repeat protein
MVASASTAGAAVAPGQITFRFDSAPTVPSVDVRAPATGVSLPDGGAVLVGPGGTRSLVLAALRSGGALDQTFGVAGIAHVTVLTGRSDTYTTPQQLLRRPDGRLLAVFGTQAATPSQLPRLLVAGLTPEGRLDPAFGIGGIADPGIQAGGDAVLQPDGSLVVSGTTGARSPGPNAAAHFSWVVARLTPGGASDAGYGDHGVVTIMADGDFSGAGLAGSPDGSVTALGRVGMGSALTRLTPGGAFDGAFNGGAPLLIGAAEAVGARSDGAVDVLLRGGPRMLRYTQAGVVDPAFGGGVPVSVPSATTRGQLLEQADGSALVLGFNFAGQGPAPVIATRVQADGTLDAPPSTSLASSFGGGQASVLARSAVQPLGQSGYQPGSALLRPDGSLLVAGGVAVVQYRGEGVGIEHQEGAVAAYGPDLLPDPSFGGPSTPARVVAGVPIQTAATAVSRKHRYPVLVVRLVTSGPGLAVVRVRAGSETVAQATVPVTRTGEQGVPVPLTPQGRIRLTGAHRVHVTVSARFADLLGRRATARGAGVLR